MNRRELPNIPARLAAAGVVLLLLLTAGLTAVSGSLMVPSEDPAAVLTATSTPGFRQYLPLMVQIGYPGIALNDAWTSDILDVRQQAFPNSGGLKYHASGANLFGVPVKVNLAWSQSGPCGASTVYTDTFTVNPGPWEHSFISLIPDCIGLFTPTVQVTYTTYTAKLPTRFVVNSPSTVLVANNQGFDRCMFPTVAQMQTWWNKSPYWVFNLYLGGSAFGCRNTPLDALWVHQVALQGWNFILTWVGPQAPCTTFNSRMDYNPAISYTQGRSEADLAADASARLGFFGDAVIYYDVEGYSSSNASCRAAVSAFMRGWAERLHERSLKAGGYGGACSSSVKDWANNDPIPDDVWLAHWSTPAVYSPTVTVWNAPCVSNSLWANHQRIKQYAGGHTETYGGVGLIIDSNVLDGQVTNLFGANPPAASSPSPVPVTVTGPQVQAASLLTPAQGWALVAGRLLWTEDGGGSWRDISPAALDRGRILGAAFRAPGDGWMAVQSPAGNQPVALQVLRTQDGVTWQAVPFPQLPAEEAGSIESAYFDLRDGSSASLVLKLQSSSSFSLGRLFVTGDGGQTWQERTIPLGEPVKFQDALHGWTAGGPTGEALYRTDDGGFTWRPESAQSLARASSLAVSPLASLAAGGGSLALLPAALPAAGVLPEGAVASNFLDAQHGWVLAQESACQGVKQAVGVAALPGQEPFRCEVISRLLATDDGGVTWREINP